MEDNKKKGLNGKYLGMVLVLVTFIAAVAVYMAVFTKTNEKNKSIQSEIDTKKAELDELKSLEAGKKETEENTKENNEKAKDIIGKFNGGVSYRSELTDTLRVENKYGVLCDSIGFTNPYLAYYFGNVTSDSALATDPDGNQVNSLISYTGNGESGEENIEGYNGYDYSLMNASNSNLFGQCLMYEITLNGSYANIRDAIKEYQDMQNDKNHPARRVIYGVDLSYDGSKDLDLMVAKLQIADYAVWGWFNDGTQVDFYVPKLADFTIENGKGGQYIYTKGDDYPYANSATSGVYSKRETDEKKKTSADENVFYTDALAEADASEG